MYSGSFWNCANSKISSDLSDVMLNFDAYVVAGFPVLFILPAFESRDLSSVHVR